jgi:hypothetical protein
MKKKNRASNLILLQQHSNHIAWLGVRKDKEILQIINAGSEPLYIPSEDEEQEPNLTNEIILEQSPEILDHVLKSISQKMQVGWLNKPELVLLLPNQRVTARYTELPTTEVEMIHDAAAFEVSEALQIPIEDIAWDFIISSQHQPDQNTKLLWLATRNEFINQLQETWPQNQLIPDQLTFDLWGYYEWIQHNIPEILSSPALIISLQGDRASITIASNDAIFVTRTISLTPSIPSATGTDPQQEKERTFVDGNRTDIILCGRPFS